MEILLAATVLTIVTAVLTRQEARRKGRSAFWWFIFGMMVPVVPLLLVWVLPKAKSGLEE
jgi:hypothetical protein